MFNRFRSLSINRLMCVAVGALFLSCSSKTAQAVFIWSPTAVVAHLGGSTPENMINQSGLNQGGTPSPFVSGTVNFGTYVAATTHVGTGFSGTIANVPGNIDFDFGQELQITRLAIWNRGAGARVTQFDVFIDDNAAFTSPTQVGSDLAQVDANSAVTVHDITDGTAQYLRLRIEGVVSTGTTPFTIGDVAVEAVPEPSSMLLSAVAIGGAGLVRYRKRKRRSGTPREDESLHDEGCEV